jgi:transcriptional regulator MraZ
MPLFLSTTTNKVDQKGRISVPAQFRANLMPHGYQGVVVYSSFKHACLQGTDMGYMERLSNSIHDNFGLFSDENEALANAILAASFQLPFDPEGRVTLPKALVEHAGLEGQATFVGLGSTFQIWAPVNYDAHRERQMELAKTEARNLRPVSSSHPPTGSSRPPGEAT